MNYLLNSKEMKDWEEKMMERYHTPSILLMERAAMSVADEILSGDYDLHKVLICCGTGNNGGDGLAVARLLTMKKIFVEVFLVGEQEKMSRDAAHQMAMYQAVCGKMVTDPVYAEYTVIIDAVFGIGCNRELGGIAAETVKAMNESVAPVISVDVPSGISCDDGSICGIAVKADVTITFFMKKIGMMQYPGKMYCGRIKIADLGIPVKNPENCSVISYDEEDLMKLPKRRGDSHKGTCGKVLVIAGSQKIGGAAYFTATAAYRMGAGLVKIYTPEENRVMLQTLLPEALTETYDRTLPDWETLNTVMSWADVIVIGPGLGTDATAENIFRYVMKESSVPLIIDADGLNILSVHAEWMETCSVPMVLTPHIEEMSRLTGKDRREIKHAPIKISEEFVRRYPVTLVLKDAVTIVAKAGEKVYLNASGNSGMSTGGSGDVLAGILGGLAAQGVSDLETARLGVYLHGRAGDAASTAKSVYYMTASDILEGIAEVTRV